MDTGTTNDQLQTSPKNAASFTNIERFKYSLDNPVTLKSLSNIRTILDQHTNFLMGLAATSSLSLKHDLTALSTIPSLFILQRIFIPLKIHQTLPEPISKGRYGVKPETKNESTSKAIIGSTEVITEPKKEEVVKSYDTSSVPATSLTKPSQKLSTEPKKEEVIKSHDSSSFLATSLTKPSRKAVAFYAEVDQGVEEIRKRLMSTSPQPWGTSLINGISSETNTAGNYQFG